MDLIINAVAFNLHAQGSEFGVGMGAAEDEFAFGFVSLRRPRTSSRNRRTYRQDRGVALREHVCPGFVSATDKILGETDNSVRVGQKTAIFRKVNQHNPTAHHDALDDRPGCGLAGGTPLLRMSGQCVGCRSAENRYAVRRYAPVAYQGGLPGYRLKRVLDHIGDNLAEDLSLPVLARSPHEPVRRTPCKVCLRFMY